MVVEEESVLPHQVLSHQSNVCRGTLSEARPPALLPPLSDPCTATAAASLKPPTEIEERGRKFTTLSGKAMALRFVVCSPQDL